MDFTIRVHKAWTFNMKVYYLFKNAAYKQVQDFGDMYFSLMFD